MSGQHADASAPQAKQADESAGGESPVSASVVMASDDGLVVGQASQPSVVHVGQVPREPAEVAPAPATPRPAPAPVTAPEEEFASLFAASTSDEDFSFEPGSPISGIVEVISLRGEEVFLDLGGKATGYVLKEELRDFDGNLTVKQGDEVSGIVEGTDAHGVRVRTTLARGGGDRAALEAAHAAGLPVEGKVAAVNKGGYEIEIAGTRGFCPMSQIDLFRPPEPAELVGQVLTFKITELRDGGEPILSRAALLRAEREAKADEVRASITPDARLTGRVRSIQTFGAFVDLGGIDGLIHVSELSWDRVNHPSEVIEMGQEVEVIVLEVDHDKDRIALSLRKALADPWEDLKGALQVGAAVEGTVARLTNFGAFITLAPSVDGLIHISDMANFRVRHPKDILAVGDHVRVKVTGVDLDQRRISLSLKALADDPWDSVAGKYSVGNTVKGKVEGIADFGVFVELEPGVTALLPISESGVPHGRPLGAAFKVGGEVELQVLRVDVDDKKMALTTRAADEIRAQGDRRGGPPGGPRRDGGGPRRDGGGPRRDGGGRDGARGGGGSRSAVAWKDDEGGAQSAFGAALLAALGKPAGDAGNKEE